MLLPGLQPGDRLLRRELHERFGGRQQGGISPSRTVPSVMFFTDPYAVKAAYTFFDRTTPAYSKDTGNWWWRG